MRIALRMQVLTDFILTFQATTGQGFPTSPQSQIGSLCAYILNVLLLELTTQNITCHCFFSYLLSPLCPVHRLILIVKFIQRL